MKSKFIGLAAWIFVAASGQAQLTNHAAAAAGAAIGTAGGKVLSNVLDKALAPAAQTGDPYRHDGVAVPKLAATSTSAVMTGSLSDAAPQSGSSSNVNSSRRTRRAAQRPYYSETADRMAFRENYQQLPPPPSVADFAKITTASSGQDVLTTLGTPSSHITIPEEGHLIEIMSYQDATHRIGRVRVDNGHVVEVTSAAR